MLPGSVLFKNPAGYQQFSYNVGAPKFVAWFCGPTLNKITRGLSRSRKNVITQASQKCFQIKIVLEKILCFWRKADKIIVLSVFLSWKMYSLKN